MTDANGEVPRRWVSEEQVLAELESLNDTSMALVTDYRVQAVKAAQAEATHKTARAKRFLTAKATGARSAEAASAEAEADDTVSTAYMERLVAAAIADATREAMRSVRTNQEALRTAVASHRNAALGPGWGGGAK